MFLLEELLGKDVDNYDMFLSQLVGHKKVYLVTISFGALYELYMQSVNAINAET